MVNDKIRALREDRDLQQRTIAKILNITQSTYSKYERGEVKIQIEDLRTLCLYYRVSSDYILGLPEGLPYPSR